MSKSKGALRGKQSRKGRTLRKMPKTTQRKGKRTLYYFYMDGCGWCEKFNPTWIKLVKKI